MLRKLLKYDMKAIFKWWWIVATTCIGVALLGGIGLRLVLEGSEEVVDNLFVATTILGGVILFFISIIALASSSIFTHVLIFWRYYKNFFSDEGYLTFTLPASRRQLFLSKTVNAMIWSVLHALVMIVGFFIMALIIPPSSNGFLIDTVVISTLSDALSLIFEGLGTWVILYAIEGLAIVLFYLLFTVSLIHMCITIGSIIAKKLKVLVAIGIFYGINLVLSFIGQFVWVFVYSIIFKGVYIITEQASSNIGNLVTALLLLILCAIVATLAFTIYCITQRLLERKLNLT